MIRNNINDLRTQNGLTQLELANLLGVTRQTIISLEKNRYVPSLEMAFKVAAVFGKKAIEDVFVYTQARLDE